MQDRRDPFDGAAAQDVSERPDRARPPSARRRGSGHERSRCARRCASTARSPTSEPQRERAAVEEGRHHAAGQRRPAGRPARRAASRQLPNAAWRSRNDAEQRRDHQAERRCGGPPGCVVVESSAWYSSGKSARREPSDVGQDRADIAARDVRDDVDVAGRRPRAGSTSGAGVDPDVGDVPEPDLVAAGVSISRSLRCSSGCGASPVHPDDHDLEDLLVLEQAADLEPGDQRRRGPAHVARLDHRLDSARVQVDLDLDRRLLGSAVDPRRARRRRRSVGERRPDLGAAWSRAPAESGP